MIAKKQHFNQTLERFNVGTIGHVDHGKTTLSLAISKVSFKHFTDFNSTSNSLQNINEIDNAPEEQKRGITINSAVIEFTTNKRHYSLVDMPGHERYIKNMIQGLSQVQTVILVISAEEQRIMPQTKEHLLITNKMLKIKRLIVFWNKVELNPEELEIKQFQLEDELQKLGFDLANVKMFFGSALEAVNGVEKYERVVQEMLQYLDTIESDPLNLDDDFLMPISKVHNIKGIGTVLAGRIERGVVRLEDKLEIVGFVDKPIQVSVKGLEMFKKTMDVCRHNDNVGILVRYDKKNLPTRGQMLCTINSVKLINRLKCKIYLFTNEFGGRKSGIKRTFSPQFYFKTLDVTGYFELSENEQLLPGEEKELIVNFYEKIGVLNGWTFCIREGSETIGSGQVIEVL